MVFSRRNEFDELPKLTYIYPNRELVLPLGQGEPFNLMKDIPIEIGNLMSNQISEGRVQNRIVTLSALVCRNFSEGRVEGLLVSISSLRPVSACLA